MKVLKRAFDETTSVRFCLSYDPLKLGFITFKMDNISRRKRIIDIDIVNDVMSTVLYTTPKCYYTCGHTIFMTRRYPLDNSDIV